METDLYFRILERLSNYGIGEDGDITPEFDNYLLQAKEPGDMFYGGERIHKIKEYLDKMVANKHITYEDLSPPTNKELTEEEREKYRKEPRIYKWVKDIKISGKITNEGLEYYHNYVLRSASINSFKSQKWNNRITWSIAISAIVIAATTSIWLGINNNSLDTRVHQLEQAQKPPTYKPKESHYPPQHIDIPLKNGG